MRRSRTRLFWIVVGSLLLVVTGCVGARSLLVQLATSDSPVEAIGDCGFRRTAQTWVDQNGNGQRDDGERALAGVTFIATDAAAGYITSDSGDPHGYGSLFIFLAGCPDVAFDVSAKPPTGYVATTPQPIRSNYPNEDEPFLFGFRRIE